MRERYLADSLTLVDISKCLGRPSFEKMQLRLLRCDILNIRALGSIIRPCGSNFIKQHHHGSVLCMQSECFDTTRLLMARFCLSLVA